MGREGGPLLATGQEEVHRETDVNAGSAAGRHGHGRREGRGEVLAHSRWTAAREHDHCPALTAVEPGPLHAGSHAHLMLA